LLLNNLHHFRRAFFHAGSAGSAFGQIYNGDIRAQVNTLLGALFHALTAFNTGNFAAFRHLLPVKAPVRTEHHRAFLISGDRLDNSLGAFCYAHPAACAFRDINYRQALFNVHANGVKFTHLHAVAKTETAERTELGSACRQLRATAVFYARVNSLLRGMHVRTLARENRDS
jgi:hypothetical protein